MSPSDAADLAGRLSHRDRAILESVERLRLLSTQHLRRLHFADGHTNPASATRATNRVLSRLEEHGLVTRLGRRMGGARGGSTSLIWQLGATGERVLREGTGASRRRFVEPSRTFAQHTLAVAELAVQLIEASRAGRFELLRLESEPSCWRTFLAQTGVQQWLKPDLFAMTATAEFEDHTFVEVDLATEHVAAVLRKARAYERYRAAGRHQAEHGVFPAVLWVVPDTARQDALTAALEADAALAGDLFRVVTTEEALPALIPGDAAPDLTTLKGGTP